MEAYIWLLNRALNAPVYPRVRLRLSWWCATVILERRRRAYTVYFLPLRLRRWVDARIASI